MPKIYQFTKKDKVGNIKNAGKMEIKNKTNNSADLFFYGDIVSTSYNPDDWWSSGDPEDRAPQDVANFLNELDGMTDINIHVNSGGGDVFAGLAIYNILKSNGANKTVYVDGLAASIASVIALAGDTVIIPKTAQFMVHNPWTFMFGGYNAADLLKVADMLDNIKQPILNVYSEHLKDGIDIETIQQMMDEEKWLTGDQAADYFNIQVEENIEAAACANSEFFSKYKHTPKNLIEGNKVQENPQNNNNEILTVLKSIENRLDKLENTNPNNSKNESNGKSNEAKKQKIVNLKAKLALECTL